MPAEAGKVDLDIFPGRHCCATVREKRRRTLVEASIACRELGPVMTNRDFEPLRRLEGQRRSDYVDGQTYAVTLTRFQVLAIGGPPDC